VFARERCGAVQRLFNYLLTNESIDDNIDIVGSSYLLCDNNLFPKFVVVLTLDEPPYLERKN